MAEQQLCNSSRSEDPGKLKSLWENLYPGKELPTDSLQVMIELQTALLHLIYTDNGRTSPTHPAFSDYERITETQYMIASIHNELEEIRDWLPWKHHKKYPSDFKIQREELLYEVIDCVHFLLNICMIWGIGFKEFFDLFIHKNLINWERKGYVFRTKKSKRSLLPNDSRYSVTRKQS